MQITVEIPNAITFQVARHVPRYSAATCAKEPSHWFTSVPVTLCASPPKSDVTFEIRGMSHDE
jgi:hypothetical protein